MQARTLMTVALVAALAALAAPAALAKKDPAPQKAKMGEKVPDFTLAEPSGDKHSLSDFEGKIVVLEWTNHQCPFVQRHVAQKKSMQKTYAKFKDKDVVWLAIDSSHFCEEKKRAVASFAHSNHVEYPVLLDPSGKVGRMFGAKTTPHMFVIDADGKLVYSGAPDDDRSGQSENPRNYVEEVLTALLDGSTPPVSRTDPYGCSVKYAQ